MPKPLSILPKTDRLPVLFLGHGSPMNALPGNAYHQTWQTLGAQFGLKWPRPRLILCVSAHWLTSGWWLTAMAQPKTIHDFGGFPQVLFDQQYPAPGFPEAAAELAELLRQPHIRQALQLDERQWGLDHGAWGVLKPMFGAADIPVIQLSMDYRRPPAEHLALGQQLQPLREQGVLIVASGNIVHNLGTMQADASADQTYDWAREFDETIAGYLQAGDLQALQDFQKLGTIARLSHPSHEHFLPLLYAAGAAQAGEVPTFFNTDFQAASISMRSVVWG
ncbi:4,5-DOPA dioxygenase extradiol [Rhodoferax sp. 4810]|nr:4,5-DOPA dioxygenase extradiol [Rhodoferax jenense]